MTWSFLIAQTELPRGALPEWILIAPAGVVRTTNGNYRLEADDAAAVIAAWRTQGVDIPLDWEHQTVPQPNTRKDGRAPAAAFIKELRFREGVGLEGRVDWLGEGAFDVQSGAYRYLSPVLIGPSEGKDKDAVLRPRRLHSVALTNVPAIERMQRLAASGSLASFLNGQLGESYMLDLKILKQALGLAEDADDSVAVNKAVDWIRQMKGEGAAYSAAKALLKLPDTADAAAFKQSLEALSKATPAADSVPKNQYEILAASVRTLQTDRDALKGELKTLKDEAALKLRETQAEALLRTYSDRIPAASVSALRAMALNDFAGAETFAKTLPILVTSGRTEPPGADNGAASSNGSAGRSRQELIALSAREYDEQRVLTATKRSYVSGELRECNLGPLTAAEAAELGV